MAQSSVRKPVNTEDAPDDQQEGQLPTYFTPLDDKNKSSWQAPDYFRAEGSKPPETERDKEKKKHTFFGDLETAADEFVKSIKDPVKPGISEVKRDQTGAVEEPTTFWGGFGKSIKDQILGATVGNEGLQDAARLRGNNKSETLGNIGNLLLPSGVEGAVAGARRLFGDGEESAIRQTGQARNATGTAGEPPIRQTSKEIPYRMGSSAQEPAAPIENIKAPERAIEQVIEEKPTVGKLISDPREIAAEDKPQALPEKKPFINPFEKVKEQIPPEVVDETNRTIAPEQAEIPTELPIKARGTGFAQSVPEVKSTELPIKRDILRDFTGEKFNPEVYDKARDMFKMGKDLPEDQYSKLSDQELAWEHLRLDDPEEYNHVLETGQEPLLPSGMTRDEAIRDITGRKASSSSEWKPPDYAQASENATKVIEPSASLKTPELVDKLPNGLEGDIKAPKQITEKPSSLSVDDTMEALNRLEREHPDASSLSENDYDKLHEKYLNEIKAEKAISPDGTTEMQGGLGGVSPSKRPLEPSSGPYANALDKLFSSMGTLSEKRLQQDVLNKTERARRFAAFNSVDEVGVKGAAQSLSKLKGEFDKVDLDKLKMTQPQVDSLFTAVKRANITPGEKARGYTTLFKLFNGELPQRNELGLLDDVFGNNFASKITELHGGIGAVGTKLSKAANTMKTMENMISLAAPLRHGIGMIARKEFYPAFKDMFKFFGNKEYYDAAMQAIEDHPKYLPAREDGLFLPKSASGADEEFLDSYIGNVPKFTGIPQAAAASKRAYTGFLNKLKFDTYKNMTEQAEKLGYNMTKIGQVPNKKGVMESTIIPGGKESRGIANFINTFTGRGDLGPLNKVTRELNLLLWSPRMIASRIQMFTSPKLYMDLPKEMRIEGLKSLLAIAGLGTMIDTAAHYAGAKVSTNILSSDFGKSRFGSDLIDPWGGFQQYVVGAARFLAGKTDSTMPISRLDIAGRFAANKESPAASLAHTLLTAKFTGKSNDPKTAGNLTTEYGQKSSVQRELMQRYMPILEQDIQSLIQSDPEWSDHIGLTAAMAGASLAGMSQNYPEKKKSAFGKMRVR